MGSLVSSVSQRWANWKHTRRMRAFDGMEAETRRLELVQVEKIAVLQTQLEITQRQMADHLAQFAASGGAPPIHELHRHRTMQCTAQRHEGDIAAAQLQLNNCYGVSAQIAQGRESSDANASVTFNKIAMKLTRMRRDPLKDARESERRDLQTAKAFAMQREAQAATSVGTGPMAISSALQEDHVSLHLDELAEEAAADTEATGRPNPLDAIRAKFAMAAAHAVLDMPEASRPMQRAYAGVEIVAQSTARTELPSDSVSPTKKKNGKKYAQLDEDVNLEGDEMQL